MNVNYIIEINGLNDLELIYPLTTTAFKLMCKLLHMANRSKFPERLSISNKLLMAMVDCSEDALVRARNQLISAGLIEYEGKKRKTPIYKINYFSLRKRNNPEKTGYRAGTDAGYNTGFDTGYNTGYDADIYININGDGNGNKQTDEDSENNMQDGGAGGMYAQIIRDQLEHNDYVRRVLGQCAGKINEIASDGEYSEELVYTALCRTMERSSKKHLGPLEKPINYMLSLLETWKKAGFTCQRDVDDAESAYWTE